RRSWRITAVRWSLTIGRTDQGRSRRWCYLRGRTRLAIRHTLRRLWTGPRTARNSLMPPEFRMAHDILIVDDEPDIRMLVDGILTDEGYETRAAGGSDAAVAAFHARRPSLVVLDVWLQGSRLDGIELLDLFQGEEPRIPVVMISGHGTIEMA